MKALCLALIFAGSICPPASARQAVWQWSVSAGESRARLWIPEHCERVRAVLLAQHNMIERSILEHPAMRRTLGDLNMAAVFIDPSIDPVFRFDQGAGSRFEEILRTLADKSGYNELAEAPVAPLGHSAHASFPWNFAAWKPERTLAAISVKGDAPLTHLTGSGRQNPEWAAGKLDGVPGLMVMSEQEWWEARLEPWMKFRAANPRAPLTLLADTGHGHFDATDRLVEFLALFLGKSAAARLPADPSVPLRAVDPARGWLADRWRCDEPPRAPAAPAAEFHSDPAEASWCHDEEMARAIDAYHEVGRGKQARHIGFLQGNSLLPISNSHAGTELRFEPEADGITFQIAATFIKPLPQNPPTATKEKRPALVTVTPEPADRSDPTAVAVSIINGPVEQVAPDKFRVALDWMFAAPSKPAEAWFLASHPDDSQHKGAVRQARMCISGFSEGAEQVIDFPALSDLKAGSPPFALHATTDQGLPVRFYVRDGPALIRNSMLHLTGLPPRAKLPVKVTVVAWQFGRGVGPKVRAAAPVARSFLIHR